ncbi:MAG: glycoside hydrolase family 3 N-terminal domain-containing protein, partial [Bacteroidota bacterium]
MKNNLLQIVILVTLFLVFHIAVPGTPDMLPFSPQFQQAPPFLEVDTTWVDSVMKQLSLEEQIAQMIMVQAYSNMGETHQKEIARLISRYHVGGIAFFQGDPVSQAILTNRYQDASEVPLLVAIDGENGLGMRLDSTIRYPSQMALGAITDNALIYQLGGDMARQMKRLGVHMNLAPVADVNNNPANPVINTRSFGEDPDQVAAKVVALMRGMQDGGLLVAAKHFPGHGDTGADSHHALPVVPYGRERLDSLELYPFREAILSGLTGIMVAHLQVPALDARENRPATVSDRMVTGVLKDELGFRGLVITDALNMKGLSKYFEPGEREVEAVIAGNDILLMPSDVGKAITEIKRAVRRGEISVERINESCRKILLAKQWTGLNLPVSVEMASLTEDLNHPDYKANHRELIAHTLTLARDRDSILPLSHLEDMKLATVTISRKGMEHVGATSDLYLTGDHFTLPSRAARQEQERLIEKLKGYNTIIVNIWNTSSYASRRYGITDETVRFVEALHPLIRDNPQARLVLNVAGTPYALARFVNLDHVGAMILSFDDDPLYQEYTLQAIFGGRGFSGKLPVSGGEVVSAGDGIDTGPPVRLGYSSPLDAGLHPDTLVLMDTIIEEAIREKAMPGCQLLVARHGEVVWHRAYGHHTYQGKRPVELTDLYDLASITKITATLPSLMRLRDQGRFHEDSLMGSFPTVPDSSNKAGLRVGDILSHQSGLVPWIPFYYITLEPLDASQQLVSHNRSAQYPLKIGPSDWANRNVKYVDGVYDRAYSPDYPIQVAENLYLQTDYRDSLYRMLYDSELHDPEYHYSDLGYYMFQQVIEAETDTMLYPYAWYNFYAPMGAETMGFLPLNRFPAERIVPTENDIFFRRQLLRGHVHDMGAAMLGGISGHAGLFGNANDLAKMMQMYLNGGSYGGERFVDAATLETYTSCWDCENENRRGLGFDRPVTEEPDAGPACDDASASSFGHSGFTGCLTWADPENGLL